jgi:hypothetical protein
MEIIMEPRGAIFRDGRLIQSAENPTAVGMQRGDDEIAGMIAAHYTRDDLVHFDDSCPEPVVKHCIIREGRVIQSASVEVAGKRIANNTLRLITLTGIGDAIWTRGVLHETLKHGIQVYLDTPFRWAFWDFEGQPGFHWWDDDCLPHGSYSSRTATYLGSDLSQGETVYGAMCKRCHIPKGDFKLPIKPEWAAEADAVIKRLAPKKPLMIYRPLVHNLGRRSVASRNPSHAAYGKIFDSIRDRFYVISVASGGKDENIVWADKADTVFHRSELSITTLVALMAKSALVYTNPGMALVVAAGIGAKVIGIFGGYEDAHNYEDTVIYGPSLLLNPIKPCRCMSDNHPCEKDMDVPVAIAKVKEFLK